MRERLSYANVMATIAVFLALGGGAFAAVKLKKNSVKTKNIKDGAVTKPKIAAQAVDTGNLTDNAVTQGKIGQNAIINEKLADGAVSRVKTDFLASSGRVVSNPSDGEEFPVPLFSLAGVTVSGKCKDDLGTRTGSFGLTGPADSFYAGIQAIDTTVPDDVASSLPDTTVGVATDSGKDRSFTSLKVVTPTSAIRIEVVIGVEQQSTDCVFAATGEVG
jgi:hypothetical protein